MVLALSGIQRASSRRGPSAEGPSAAFGASIQVWNAAFEKLDGVWELVWETATGTASTSVNKTQDFADLTEERSGGKMTVEIAFQQAIAGKLQDDDEAFGDGSTDMHLLVPFQQASDLPSADGSFRRWPSSVREVSRLHGDARDYHALHAGRRPRTVPMPFRQIDIAAPRSIVADSIAANPLIIDGVKYRRGRPSPGSTCPRSRPAPSERPWPC